MSDPKKTAQNVSPRYGFNSELQLSYQINCKLLNLKNNYLKIRNLLCWASICHGFNIPPASIDPTITTRSNPENIKIAWTTSVQITALIPPSNLITINFRI